MVVELDSTQDAHADQCYVSEMTEKVGLLPSDRYSPGGMRSKITLLIKQRSREIK